MTMAWVTLIEDKLRDNTLKWFGHVYRRSVDAVVRSSDMVVFDGSTSREG